MAQGKIFAPELWNLLLDRWDRHPQSPLPRIPDLFAVLQAAERIT